MGENYFEWDESKYDVKVAEMNHQHQKLIAIMNRLYSQREEKAPYETLLKTLEELRDYTVTHFKEEEAYLEKISFPQIEIHKKVHENLLKTFGENYQEFTQTKELSDKFFIFLKTWLSGHIQGVDRKYGEHAQKTKQAA